MPTLLTDAQLQRYSRQLRLEALGVAGQARLLASKVAVVGAGALGSAAAIYLAAAGVGTIGLIDADHVDLSNLHRQILHMDRDQGRPKTQSGRRHLEDLNPDVQVVEHRVYLSSENALEVLRRYDLVVNGSDNFPTRYLVNDACVLLGKPLVDASILMFEGQATAFVPGKGCYRCLYPAPPPAGSVPSCAEAGVIGALAGQMGSLQALEAIKLLLGIGESLAGRLLTYDALYGEWRVFKYKRRANCPACGDQPTITQLIDYAAFCGAPARPAADSAPLEAPAADPAPLAELGAAPAAPGAATGDATAAAAATAGPAAGELTAPVVAARLGAGEVDLIDVRTEREFARGHIAGARLLPAGAVNARLGEIDPERTTVLVCNVGELSGMVVGVLREAGYSRVFNLAGGIAAWENHGLPLAPGAP